MTTTTNTEFKTCTDAVRYYYNAVKNNELDISEYLKKHGNNFEGIDTNRFVSFVFAETRFKPTTIERVFRSLRQADRNSSRSRRR